MARGPLAGGKLEAIIGFSNRFLIIYNQYYQETIPKSTGSRSPYLAEPFTFFVAPRAAEVEFTGGESFVLAGDGAGELAAGLGGGQQFLVPKAILVTAGALAITLDSAGEVRGIPNQPDDAVRLNC